LKVRGDAVNSRIVKSFCDQLTPILVERIGRRKSAEWGKTYPGAILPGP
jgi:hypothetical protein